MPRFKIIVEYDGTNYFGWQSQQNKPSIQSAIQSAIKSFCGIDTDVYGCGRTDAGVHAYAMPAHFDLPNSDENFNSKKLETNTIRDAINYHIGMQNNSQIKILSAQKVNDDFHARFDCVKRHYVYKILIRDSAPSLMQNRVWHMNKQLSISDMKSASKFLIGQHDFTSFRSIDCQSKSPIKTLDEIRFECIDNSNENYTEKHINIYFSARSFLHHQVRNMTGALVDIGLKKFAPFHIKEILDARDRTASGINAPAYALYFLSAEYPTNKKS